MDTKPRKMSLYCDGYIGHVKDTNKNLRNRRHIARKDNGRNDFTSNSPQNMLHNHGWCDQRKSLLCWIINNCEVNDYHYRHFKLASPCSEPKWAFGKRLIVLKGAHWWTMRMMKYCRICHSCWTFVWPTWFIHLRLWAICRAWLESISSLFYDSARDHLLHQRHQVEKKSQECNIGAGRGIWWMIDAGGRNLMTSGADDCG